MHLAAYVSPHVLMLRYMSAQCTLACLSCFVALIRMFVACRIANTGSHGVWERHQCFARDACLVRAELQGSVETSVSESARVSALMIADCSFIFSLSFLVASSHVGPRPNPRCGTLDGRFCDIYQRDIVVA